MGLSKLTSASEFGRPAQADNILGLLLTINGAQWEVTKIHFLVFYSCFRDARKLNYLSKEPICTAQYANLKYVWPEIYFRIFCIQPISAEDLILAPYNFEPFLKYYVAFQALKHACLIIRCCIPIFFHEAEAVCCSVVQRENQTQPLVRVGESPLMQLNHNTQNTKYNSIHRRNKNIGNNGEM